MIILVIFFLIIFFIGVIIVSWRLSNKILKPNVIEYEQLYDREITDGRLNEALYNKWEKDEFEVLSQFGYPISCMLINNELSKKQFDNSYGKKKIAILVHGYTCNKYSSMVYADFFLKRGITVLTYDHRNHGLSGKAFTSMGYYEKFDLQNVIDWCFEQYDNNVSIVTHGESMGAATVLSHLAIDGRVHCAIADCSYSSLTELVRYQIKKFHHLPKFPFLNLAGWIIKLRAGFPIQDVVPLDGAVITNAPVLFIHGLEDDYIPTKMSQDMYDAKPDKKDIYLVPGAKHAKSVQVDSAAYEQKLFEFLDTYNF